MSFKTVFAGTAPFGIPLLQELSTSPEVDLQAVITQPARRRGRGQKKQPTPVGKVAADLGVELYEPKKLNQDPPAILQKDSQVELFFVVAYGQILSPEIFRAPSIGTYNFHASILPRWRGAAPIRHALMAGDELTGVCLFELVEALDAGPVCVSRQVKIDPDETYGKLYQRLAPLNCLVFQDFIQQLKAGSLECHPQQGEPSYAGLIKKSDARIDWTRTAEQLERHVRAFQPKPGAYTKIAGERIIISRVSVVEATGYPGEIVTAKPGELIIATGEDGLLIEQLKPAGSREMDSQDFLAGRPAISPGDQLS